MSTYTHETVPTQFVEANGIRYAYRRFGKPGTIPLLFLEFFNSNMDGWDPAVTNSLAADNEVILSGFGLPVNWIAADIVRLENGTLVEHWDVIQDEATEEQSKSKAPMFGLSFPVYSKTIG